MGQFLTTAEKFAKLRKWQAESWQEYGSKIERAQETLIGEQKVRPSERQKFSAIKKQFIKGVTFLTEEMKLIMTCQDMQTLVETAEQDQERREAIRKQRNMKDGFARMEIAKPIQRRYKTEAKQYQFEIPSFYLEDQEERKKQDELLKHSFNKIILSSALNKINDTLSGINGVAVRRKLNEGGPTDDNNNKPILLSDYLKLGLTLANLNDTEREIVKDLLDKSFPKYK